MVLKFCRKEYDAYLEDDMTCDFHENQLSVKKF